MKKSAASSIAGITISSRLPLNPITSLKLKNEDTLAGQLTQSPPPVVNGTFTPELSNMLGHHKKRPRLFGKRG